MKGTPEQTYSCRYKPALLNYAFIHILQDRPSTSLLYTIDIGLAFQEASATSREKWDLFIWLYQDFRKTLFYFNHQSANKAHKASKLDEEIIIYSTKHIIINATHRIRQLYQYIVSEHVQKSFTKHSETQYSTITQSNAFLYSSLFPNTVHSLNIS